MTKHTFPCFLYHIYLSHVFLYIHVSVKYLSIFLHMYTYIFYTHIFYITFFHNCALPDVASAILALLHVISLVSSVIVNVGEDNEPNNIEFVLIDIHCEFMETFL